MSDCKEMNIECHCAIFQQRESSKNLTGLDEVGGGCNEIAD